jgi:hypothetical protein
MAIEVLCSDIHFKTDSITVYYEGILCGHYNPTGIKTEGEACVEIF